MRDVPASSESPLWPRRPAGTLVAMPTRAFIAVVALCVTTLSACTGDEPVLPDGGAGGDDAGGIEAGSGDGGGGDGGGAGCNPIPGDLLSNGSFEKASTTGTIATWKAEPALVQRAGGADACTFWAEQSSTTAKLHLEHAFDFGANASKDTTFELGMSVRSLDGNDEPIVVALRVVNGSYKVTKTERLSGDAWKRIALVLPLVEDGRELAIEIDTESPRKLGFDRVFVRKSP